MQLKEQIIPESARARSGKHVYVDDTLAPLVPEKSCEDSLLDICREIYQEASFGKVSTKKMGQIQKLSARAVCEARMVKAKIIGLKRGDV